MGCVSNFKFPFEGNTLDLDDIFVRKAQFTDGGLWIWGDAILGNNSTINRSSPVQTVAGGTNWKQVSGSVSGFAAVKTDGTLWTWGCGSYGQLGNNSTINRSSPVQTVSATTDWKQVSRGDFNISAIKTDGTLWLWGDNSTGTVGNNSTIHRSSPVQTVSATTDWKQVSLLQGHNAAIKTDGTLWLWGYNQHGRLGDNSTINRSSPVQTVSATTDWKQVSAGSAMSAAIKTDGTLWTWGYGVTGELGNNIASRRSSPVQTVSATTNWKQVSAGSLFTASIKNDGTLWTWGSGLFGVLGNNSGLNQSSPVQTVSATTNWKQVSAGVIITGAIKTDGTLWVWGGGQGGNLGDNFTTNRSSPVQTVATGNTWIQVSDNEVTAAIRENCW